MGASNLTVPAMDSATNTKGSLTVFIDEYVFNGKSTSIDWGKAEIIQRTTKVKGFMFSSEKPCVVFKSGSSISPQFVLEQQDMRNLLNIINDFSFELKKRAEEVEARQRKEQEQKAKEEAEKRKKEEEKRLAEEAKTKQQEEKERFSAEERERRIAEKQSRIKSIVESTKAKQDEVVSLEDISIKASACFLDNPYRILGVSCSASNEEANTALDKLKKLARLKALEAYSSPFDLRGLSKPTRDLSVAQNALTQLKDKSNKFFWFDEPDACIAWQEGKYRIELAKEGEELGTYDLFLANYMYAMFCDPNFNVAETWKRVFNFYVYICKQSGCELLRSRYSEKEQDGLNNADLLNSFRTVIFKPLLAMCERDDLDAVIRLHKYIKDCDNKLLEGLLRNVVGKLVSWFTDKEAMVMSFLRDDDEESISDARGVEIRECGEKYCSVVEPVLQVVLRDFKGDPVKYEMIKESYRSTTYQLMYELNKCSNKSNAIIFANKCYGYCNADTKMRIRNTFGEANIKSIDWNVPHTGWDAKGDDYFYGRGRAVDYTQALYWYHKAADEGNMYSMNSIGVCYQEGKGVPQSDEQAISWFRQASEAGNPQGAYNLAECYFEGKGIGKNIDMALKYWGEAAKNGHPSAEKRKAEVFATVQVKRRAHRASNHICIDLGFQMTTGPRLYAEVNINQPANVYLVNQQGYQNYLNGNEFSYQGGHTSDSTYHIRIPSSNHWYVVVDNGDETIAGITATAKVKS